MDRWWSPIVHFHFPFPRSRTLALARRRERRRPPAVGDRGEVRRGAAVHARTRTRVLKKNCGERAHAPAHSRRQRQRRRARIMRLMFAACWPRCYAPRSTAHPPQNSETLRRRPPLASLASVMAVVVFGTRPMYYLL
eukprot:scaffold14582_cov108-Isochrysis_galbana.AAC.9